MIDVPPGSDPLAACLLDLHAILGAGVPLIVGGGYGLYLRMREHPLFSRRMHITRFMAELAAILSVSAKR